MFKLVLEQAEEPEIKLPTSTGSWKKQESSRKTSISGLLTMPKPLTVWITINWTVLKEIGIPDHLICLFRNLYAGQEATVRTGQGTTDWFQIGKGVLQGCILSPGLFNLYAEYIMGNAARMNNQLESTLPGEISTTSDRQMKGMGIPDHLTCLLRNLYAGQEATVRTGYGTTDWFQIGKGVRQGCILSPCSTGTVHFPQHSIQRRRIPVI